MKKHPVFHGAGQPLQASRTTSRMGTAAPEAATAVPLELMARDLAAGLRDYPRLLQLGCGRHRNRNQEHEYHPARILRKPLELHTFGHASEPESKVINNFRKSRE